MRCDATTPADAFRLQAGPEGPDRTADVPERPQISPPDFAPPIKTSTIMQNCKTNPMAHSGARLIALVTLFASTAFAAPPATAISDSPAEHLPPHIRQITAFGERADWSHDGKKILFLSKTFGDAMEIDLD